MRTSILPSLTLRLVLTAAPLLATLGCHWASGVQTCLRGEACPDGEVCNETLGICAAPVDEPASPAAEEGEAPIVPSEGEGEPVGEGEGEPAEGEDEPVAAEGEGEGEPVGEGEGEGEIVIGEGEGEGEEPVITMPTAVCGNGLQEAGEQCDDNDALSGDGCSSTCRVDFAIAEQEPNDFPEEASSTTASPLVFTGEIELLQDNLGTFSEFDALWLNSTRTQLLRIETFDQQNSDDCQGQKAFRLELHDEDVNQGISGASLQRRAALNGIGNCTMLTIPVVAAEYITVVYEITGQQRIPAYRMQVSTLESRGTEAEPNDGIDTAQLEAANGLDVFMTGSFGLDDIDVYAVHVPAGRSLRAEIVPQSSTLPCESFAAQIALIDDAGFQVAGRGTDVDACPFIDGHGATPWDVQASNRTGSVARTQYVVVKGSPEQVGTLAYHVALTVR